MIVELEPKYIETMPEADAMVDGVLYVSMKYELAIHLCACGCGVQTVTPFHDGTSGWTLTNNDNKITLRPSIGNQQFPCKSHYWITDNQIVRC